MNNFVHWQTTSGLQYSFGIFDKNGFWHNVPGVYLFARRAQDGKWDVLYVGQCSSFRDRIPNHERWAEAARAGASTVHATVEIVEASRQALEADMIARLDPPLNKQQPLPPIGLLFPR